ncbi:MAG TPA: hypothetical protein VL137_03695, partial [Polyangiaceae bacterium]|nr:hypothetical protein [Polyangiaceae bacterium]
SCAKSPTGSSCHVTQDTRGNAFGNLSVQSYDKLIQRRDLFISYGPYGMPALLLKTVPPQALRLTNWAGDSISVTTDIPHVGGALFDLSSTAFTQIQRWIRRGATENNTQAPERVLVRTQCRTALGTDPAFDPNVDPATPDYGTFLGGVNKVLGQQCAAGNCHGSPANSLYLTCGQTLEQQRWNYFAASDYVSSPPETSEMLRRTLNQAVGGTFHEGGSIFELPSEQGYQAILRWATEKGGPTRVPTDPGFLFFADRVQPMLVKKGCMIVGCHSPAMFHDYRLRGGSGGHFGLPATRTNYRLTLEQLNLASDDPTASRLIKKNLPLSQGGIRHRGGALLAASDRAACDLDAAQTGPLNDQDPYCVIAAWMKIERTARRATLPAFSSIVYVQRPAPTGPDTFQDFEAFNAGADLRRAPVTVDAQGWPTLGASESLLVACGLSVGRVDVRRPAVSWDAGKIAFSARSAADQPWQIYVIGQDGTCAVESTIAAAAVDDQGSVVPANGELIHNFDPAFAPNGDIVFSSTRGNVMNAAAYSYSGPQRSPADPSRLNANLYVLENGAIRQLTFLLDQELLPSFMGDGRVIFTTEKRAPNFYQLAGRRIDLDGGDYHPLFAQRSTIGFNQLTDIVELSDKNLVAIGSERGAIRGAGALALINRSLGIDQRSTTAADYVQDPGAITYPNEDFYQHSLSLVDDAASGLLSGTQGAYKSPSPLPDGKLLVSYAAGATDLASFADRFALTAMNPQSGERRVLLDDPTNDIIWPVAVFARDNRGVFVSRLDEANGSTHVAAGNTADVTYMDLPFFTSLVLQNTRSKRIFDTSLSSVEFWEQLPPEVGVHSYADGGAFVIQDQFGSLYVRRRRLGSVSPDKKDGSAHVTLPGGVPVSIAATIPLADGTTGFHHQREATQYYPGEVVRQGFPRDIFRNLCGGCHGAPSGKESEIAVNPDILTQASQVAAINAPATDLTKSSASAQPPPFP